MITSWIRKQTKADYLKSFDKYGAAGGLVHNAPSCLGWFISQIMNNKLGKPLRLQPFQMVMLDMLWYKKFPMIIAARGSGKTFILAVYCLLRALLVPGSKIVICGAGYRQAKLVFKEIHNLYDASPIIQEAASYWGGPKYGSDAATFKVGLSEITAIPIGDGDKVRGFRATVLIADEYGSIPEETFEIVLSPFTSVHANPAQRAAIAAFIKRLQDLNADPTLIEHIQNSQDFGNQIVISGTATYKFNHFYKRFKSYKMFIESRGDKESLKKAMEARALAATGRMSDISPDDIDRMAKMWHHYAVMQLPYYALPPEFLDEDTVRSNRATFSSYRFKQEYEAEFPDDSDGFIKRSQLLAATPKAPDEIPVPVELFGDPRETYVCGIDPARHNDNCAVVVLKLTSRGKEFVYCDAWNKTEYGVSADRIRDVVKKFNVQYIAMDQGGGGEAIQEWLCKKQEDVRSDELIWPIPEQLEKASDRAAPGRKILEIVNFGGGWTPEAAHSLEANINQRNLLFPETADDKLIIKQFMRYYNLQDISNADKERLSYILWGMDDWEAKEHGTQPTVGIWQHVQECMNETCAIVKEVTEGGVERFILPKLSDQPEGLDMRRRDRFSALMLANYAAKVYQGHGHKLPNPIGLGTGPKRSLTRRSFRRRGSVAY